ncbi:MAG: arginine repressor [Actinobacteria bacterium]|nr:arginine repressor [Actinomycetota bacterium]
MNDRYFNEDVMNSANRRERLKAIKEIIRSDKVSSQEELVKKLEEKGFSVTQSTISRDLRDLRLVKVRNYRGEEYYAVEGSKYAFGPVFDEEKLRLKFRESVLSVSRANNIIVVKTYPGEAQGVAAVIDGMNFVEVLGTVAGDDTIICVIDNEGNAQKLLEFIQNL